MDGFDERSDDSSAASEGTTDESGGPYVCPTCSREFPRSGTCPEHGEELLPEQELNG